jgi:hypothetical protein
MSLIRDRPLCSHRRAAGFLKGAKQEISVEPVTFLKCRVMNSRAERPHCFRVTRLLLDDSIATEHDAALQGHCTVAVHLGALSYARIGHHAPRPALSAAGIVSVNAIGDSLAPGPARSPLPCMPAIAMRGSSTFRKSTRLDSVAKCRSHSSVGLTVAKKAGL